jgi:WD40 repeat protein
VVLHQCGIEECLPYIETDLQFYPNRSEIVNASAWAESLRTKSTTNPDSIPVIDPFGSGIILMEVLAHRGPVTSLNYSSLRHSLFSCCELTRVVRVWDPLTMNLEGEINQNTLK